MHNKMVIPIPSRIVEGEDITIIYFSGFSILDEVLYISSQCKPTTLSNNLCLKVGGPLLQHLCRGCVTKKTPEILINLQDMAKTFCVSPTVDGQSSYRDNF